MKEKERMGMTKRSTTSWHKNSLPSSASVDKDLVVSSNPEETYRQIRLIHSVMNAVEVGLRVHRIFVLYWFSYISKSVGWYCSSFYS